MEKAVVKRLIALHNFSKITINDKKFTAKEESHKLVYCHQFFNQYT